MTDSQEITLKSLNGKITNLKGGLIFSLMAMGFLGGGVYLNHTEIKTIHNKLKSNEAPSPDKLSAYLQDFLKNTIDNKGYVTPEGGRVELSESQVKDYKTNLDFLQNNPALVKQALRKAFANLERSR